MGYGLGSAGGGSVGGAGVMGDHDDVVEFPEGVVGGSWGVGGGFGVLVPGVDGCAGDGAVFESVVERCFVDDVSACGVDDVRGGFH